MSSGETPPGFVPSTHEFETDVAGRLMVMLSGSFERGCTPDGAAFRINVGTLVGDTDFTVRTIEASEVVGSDNRFEGTLHGVIEEIVPAGRHFVSMSSSCVAGGATGTTVTVFGGTNATLLVIP